MNSYEIVERLDSFQESLEEHKEFINFLITISTFQEKLNQQNYRLISAKDSTELSSINSIKNKYLALINDVREILKRKGKIDLLFVQIADFKESIKEFENKFEAISGDPLHSIYSCIDRLTENYEEVVQSFSGELIATFIHLARDLVNALDIFSSINSFVASNLQDEIEVEGASIDELSLLFDSKHLYKDAIIKLQLIQDIYSELCQLIGISEIDFPLRIAKIETGSLFVKVFGESRVIGLLLSFVREATLFFYRNFTTEGKISSLPRQVEAIETVLNITKKLEEAGVDVSASKESLQKTSIIMAEKLNDLLLGEPNISLNKEKLSIGAELEEKYLTSSKKRLLGSREKINSQAES